MFDIFDTIAPGYDGSDKTKVEPKEIIKFGPSEPKNPNPEAKLIKKASRKKKIDDEPKSEEIPSDETTEEVNLPSYNDEPLLNTEIIEEKQDPLEEDVEEENEDENDLKNEKDENAPLTFMENPETGHAMVGRKTSVFKKYGEEASLFLGTVNEPNYPQKEIYFDSLDPQVIFVCGSRGSGKSYILGVVAEELALKNKNVGQIVIDPVGVFWSMKHPNREDREIAELAKFGLEPKGLDNVIVFVPEGASEKIPKETYDATFTIQPAFLTSEDWALTFGIDRFSPSGLLLEKVIKKVREGYRAINGLIFRPKADTFDLNDIILCLENDSELSSKDKGYRKESIRALVSRFEAAKTWGLFSKRGTPLIELSVPGQLTVIDTSFLDENVSALLVGILARRVLSARKMSSRKEASKKINNDLPVVDLENDIPPTWLFLDEAHTLIPSGSLATPASKSIVEYVKQGRKPGCSLIIATQQPSAIDTRVLSQVGTLITYKLIFDDDIKAVFKRMPTIVPKRFKEPGFIKKLGIGIPLFADKVETTSRAFVMTIRPRMSQHEGREIQTAETQQNLTQEEILRLMVTIAKNKIRQFEELDAISIRTLLKILNMKYKTDIDFDTYHNALMNAEVIFEKDKYFMIKESETEQYEEKTNYSIIEPQFDSEEIEGFVKRTTGWQNFTTKLVYRPIFKVNYKIHNDDGSYVDTTCYIDSVKVEFVHFLEKDFAYSAGLSILRTLEADDIRILMNLPKKQGFDMDFLKDNFAFGDVKLKNTMDRFSTLGLLRRERRGTKNVFFLIKNLEVPINPLHKVLSTLDDLPVIIEPVKKEEILEARATFETVRNVLGTLWETIKIDDIATILKQEYLVTNLDTKETAIFDTHTGKKIN